MDDAFEQFWSAYPRREAKKDARRAWHQVDGDAHLVAILAALRWQCASEQWTKAGGQYVPLPASYLRGERWEDEPPALPHLREKTARNLSVVESWAKRA